MTAVDSPAGARLHRFIRTDVGRLEFAPGVRWITALETLRRARDIREVDGRLELHAITSDGATVAVVEPNSDGFGYTVVGVRARPLIARDMAQLAQFAGPARSRSPVGAARRLTGGAARLVHREHRPRYAAEFQSELHELAASGASRWRQLAYALHLFNNVFILRAELRSAKRSVSG